MCWCLLWILIEFEKHNPIMKVCGSRELKFYPGVCKGTIYPGFVYNSEEGARSVSILLNKSILKPYYHHDTSSLNDDQQQLPIKSSILTYYNGGGYFVHPEKLPNVEVLARFEEPGICTDETHPAAIVDCHIGKGNAILITPHLEYDAAPEDLNSPIITNTLKNVMKDIISSEYDRKLLLRALFARIGLTVLPYHDQDQQLKIKQQQQFIESPLYLAMNQIAMNNDFPQLLNDWMNLANPVTDILESSYNAFHLLNTDDHHNLENNINSLNISNKAIDSLSLQRKKEGKPPITKLFYMNPSTNNSQLPIHEHISTFDFKNYFNMLDFWRRKNENDNMLFGNTALFAHVIESTQTILDKNYSFTNTLPTGAIALATHQIAGRGRGRNSWISQEGGVQFSLLIRHSLNYKNAPIVFLQYLISLAVVESIRTRVGYEQVPLYLKWPNDIYGLKPNSNISSKNTNNISNNKQGLEKIGGLLVNSHYVDNEFMIIIGCGLNLSNKYPTTSINDIIKAHDPSLPLLSSEDVLANILVTFESFYNQFCKNGIGSWFFSRYYSRWLHSDQLVTLKTHDDAIVRIQGISKDYGFLVARDLKDNSCYELQPDGNSFDMFNGLLIYKK
ncbi:unnamed protein product [Cunninghamella echinulata]